MSATATTEKKYLKWYQKLAYGSGDLASNCSYGLVSSFVLLYLTGTLGLDSAIIGSLMLASKVLDGISDVIFGTLIDRTHSKLGKARPWMLFGQVGVSLCLFLLFAIPAGSTTMQYIYFFIVYTALNAVFYTANGIAYSSLVALITKNNNERVQLGSFRFMFAVVTNIFMGFAVTGMVEKFGSGAAGWRTTALIFAIVGLVVNTISCLAVKELPEEELSGNTSEAAEEGKAVAEEKKHGFAETAKILVHNKYYLMILAIYIVYYIMSNLTTGAGVFCATYYWGDGSLLGQFSMMKMFPVIIALAFAPVLIKKTGSMQKVNFWGYAISSVLGIPMIYFAMQKNLSMFLLFMFIKGIFAGTLSGSLNALIAEASGYTTRTTGVHNKYYLMILAIYIVYYIMSNLTTGAGVFCATYYWGDGSLLGQFSMMKMFPVIIALAIAPVLIKKTGSMQKVNFWGYAISSVLGIPMIYFAMQKNLSMFLLFMFIKGVFAGTLSGSLNALIAEASGYTTRTTGVHMDGMMYSCSSLGVKVGGGIGTAAVGWLLKLGGFVGTATVQSESAIRMIFNLYITFPFVIGIIITVLLAFLDVEKANKKWDAEHKKEAQA